MQDVLPDIAADPAPSIPRPAPEVLPLQFSGSGKEYFRIWIVNLLLTVATLGLYSAWAKVRRLQYFYRNTTLAGASFDFTGKPVTILKGRLVAAALVAAYHFAFGVAAAASLAVAGALVLALPFLARSALRFRLANTRYRGLAFSFNGGVAGAYLAYLPPLAMLLLPALLLTIDRSGKLTAAAMLLYLAWPAMHGAMKRYQHRNLQFGDQPARFDAGLGRFYRPYFGALGMVLTSLLLMLLAGALTTLLTRTGGGKGLGTGLMVLGMLAFYLVILSQLPYLQARIYNLAWSNTTFPGVAIRSTLGARGLLRVHALNTVLTVLTLGLYRPFAVVRVYRYRLEHVTLAVDGDLEAALATTQPRQLGAAGDGAADFFGIDISW